MKAKKILVFHYLFFAVFFAQAQVLLTGTLSGGNFLVRYPANITSTVNPGFSFTFLSLQTVTGPVGLNLNGTGVFPLTKLVNIPLAANEILAGQFVTVAFDGSKYQILSILNQITTGTSWLVGGNTVTGAQNLGTLSNVDLPIITNSIERMRVSTSGFVGIGTNPKTRLHVSSALNYLDTVPGVTFNATVMFENTITTALGIALNVRSNITSTGVAAVFEGGQMGLYATANVDGTGSRYGVRGIAGNGTSGTGLDGNGSGTSYAYGVRGTANSDNGEAYGGYFNSDGQTYSYGVYSYSNVSTGTGFSYYGNITNNAGLDAYGINLTISHYGSGNAYGSYLNTTNYGSIGDSYGIYSNVYGTKNVYGIYSNVFGGTNNYPGIFLGGNVGIGTTLPTYPLDIIGSLRMADGTEGEGKLLTSNSVGGASWSTQLVYGIVNGSNGRVNYGSGNFTVTKYTAGEYYIAFNTPFQSTPSVTAITGTGSTAPCSSPTYGAVTYMTGCTSGDFINSFSWGGISRSATGCEGTGGYIQTSFQAFVNAGTTYPLSVQSGATYSQGIKIWIDWNNDGDFDDAGEDVFGSTAATTAVQTGNITVPTTAVTGCYLRMRVRSSYNCLLTSSQSTGNACNASFGETEDYSVYIYSNAGSYNTGKANYYNSTPNGVYIYTVNSATNTNANYDFSFQVIGR